MLVVAPASLRAQDPSRGLLHSDGGTWLNDAPAPAVAAIFPDSLVETQEGHIAKIDVYGSTVVIQPETMVQFQGHELVLDHGTLQLDTSLQMEVIVGCITITPVKAVGTQYDVTDAGGKVRVSASKNDVKIHTHGAAVRKTKNGSSDSIVREGEHSTRAERCGPGVETQQQATGPGLDSRWAEGAGAIVAGALICLGLCHGDDPISPAKP
jgi:hypothetical protein